MKYALSLLALASLAAAPAQAADRGERFKLSFDTSVVTAIGAPGQLRSGMQDYDFRSGITLEQAIVLFRNDYLIPNGAGHIYFEPVGALCCANDHEVFDPAPGGYHGKIGDEYRTWGRGTLQGISERGYALGGSLEYRVTGPLWLAFSVQTSKETSLDYNEIYEFFRTEGQYTIPSNVPTTTQVLEVSRRQVNRDVRQTYSAASYTMLAKVDLTRSNPHWSVLPQAGVDLLVSREKSVVETTNYQWKIFGGERHPSDWAHRPEKKGSHTDRETDSTRYTFRPVIGLALELYPVKKAHHIAIVADGRYHFSGHTSYEQRGQRENPYWDDAPIRAWTLSLGVLVKF